ncbi:MAG: OmpA family protein [Myxococcales bacterium]|nr:OmpA family protein [Myxococcales bacterium]
MSFLIVAGVAACGKKKPKNPTCDSTEDCKNGLVCVNKQCVACAVDDDCGDGQRCDSGACVAKPECAKDTDCPDGKVCQAGTCRACAKDNECGPGGKCMAGACQRPTACTTDEQCADDEDCVDGYCQKPWLGGGGDNACTLATIYFGYDDSSIAPSERDRLDANSACMNKSAARAVYVMGHTDGSGTDEYNIALSERRAQTVADYLARLGVDPAKMQVVPKGETEPTGQGEDKDRRVEFQWR